MPRYTPTPGFSDKFSQERITVRLHALKEVKESMSKQCLIEPKNNYNGLVFRPGAGWPEDFPRDTHEIKNLKETFRAVFSTQIEKCARNFRPERFSATFRKRERYTFWVGWKNEWQDAQKAGQLRRPGFKIEEELERIFKEMESYLYGAFDEMMRAEMEVIIRKTTTQKDLEPNKAIKFKVIQGNLAMDCHWNRKARHDVLCHFEEEENDDATQSEVGADEAAATQLINEANQPRGNRNLPSDNAVEVCRTVLQSMIEVLRTRKNEISAEAFLEFPEFIPGELYWVRRLKRRMRPKYREHLGSLAMLIDDPFFHTTVEHSVFCAYVANWSERFEETRSLYTPGPLERVENIYNLQRKLRKLDRHMSTFLTSYYNDQFTRKFRDLCSMEMEKQGLSDNTMWFQVRLRRSYEEDKHHQHHLHIATHLPENLTPSMVLDKRWDDLFSDYIDPDYDFDAEDDGDMEPVNIDELPRVFNWICTIKRDGKMEHQTLIEEEELNEDEVIEIDSDEDAPQAVVPESGKRKRGRPRKEETAAKRRQLSNSGRDEALLDESARGRSPQRSDLALIQRAYRERRERAPSASSQFTELDDDVIEALNPAHDNEATIVVDSRGASSSTQASNSNRANNHAGGPSRKRQNGGTIGFSGDGGDDRHPKRNKKELPADKDADDEDQPDPKDKGKGKESAPIYTGKKKRGRPKGSKNKPKIPIAPNLVVNRISNTINSRVLIGAGPTPPGYHPPPNPVPGPDDIPDNAVLTTSDRPLNASSVRMDRSPPPGVNIPERPQYLTPGTLSPTLLDLRGIFANHGRVMQRPQIRAELVQRRPEEQQQRQQQRRQQPRNSPLQAPQQRCTRISPSHAGNSSSVSPQAGTSRAPIDLDSDQSPAPIIQRQTTNSPHPGAPNPFPADQSQADPSNIALPQPSATQPRQQDQQQSVNTDSPYLGIARPPSAADSQPVWSNTARPNSGSTQPRVQSQPRRPQLAHPRGMQSQINNNLGQPLGNYQDQFQTGRGEPLSYPMPPLQGNSPRQVAFPPAHTQARTGPSHTDSGLRRILKQQEAGGSSQAQFRMQQQSPSPRLARHGPSRQQGGVRSPQPYSQVLSHGHFRGSMPQGQYYAQQPQYNMQYSSAVYVQQGGISQNIFATGQEQLQYYTFNQQGIPNLSQLPPQAAFTQDLPNFDPAPPYEVTQQFQPQHFQHLPVEYQAAQYHATVQHTREFQGPRINSDWIGDHVVQNPPMQQQTSTQQAYLPTAMSRNPSGTLQGAPREIHGQQPYFTDVLNNAREEVVPDMADSYENLVREGGKLL